MSETVTKASAASLAGLRVILTRPRRQCDALIAMLGDLGAEARCLPVVEIEPPEDTAPAVAALEDAGRFNLLVFTSPNAVGGALSLRPDLPEAADLPEVATVGPATRRALVEAGICVAITPEDEFSSEGLLRHPRLDQSALRGKRVLIVKGAGGRGLLAQGLEAAGAEVATVDVYRRCAPQVGLSKLLGEPPGRFDLIVFTSGTAIEHTLDVASKVERQQILQMPMVVSSGRIARIARARGARRSPLVADGPDDRALVRAVESWRGIRPEKT